MGRDRDAAIHPTMHRTGPCSKELSRQNISIAEVRNACLYPSKANEILSSEAFEDSMVVLRDGEQLDPTIFWH